MAQLRSIDIATGQGPGFTEGDDSGSFWYDQRQQMIDQGVPGIGAGQGGMQSPGFAPLPVGPGGSVNDNFNDPRLEGNAQSPREREPDQSPTSARRKEPQMDIDMGAGPQSPSARTISPPSLEAQMGMQMGQGAQMTPQRPMEPSPQAGAMSYPAQTFKAPQPLDLVKPDSTSLYGKAGGLLGGGLGVPGTLDKGENDPSKLLSILATLLKG